MIKWSRWVVLALFCAGCAGAGEVVRGEEPTPEALGLIESTGIAEQPAELSPQGQEAFSLGIDAARQQDYKLALSHFLNAQKADPDSPQIWFNLGLASAKLPGYELRALAWFQAYLLAVPDASNADAVRKQLSSLENKFESKMSQILDQLEPLLENDPSEDSKFLGQGIYLAYARSFLGDFEGGLRVLRTATGKSNWQDAFSNFPDEANVGYGYIDSAWREGQIEYLLDFGIRGAEPFGIHDIRLADSFYMDGQPKPLLSVFLQMMCLSSEYRILTRTFDPGKHPDPFWSEYYRKIYINRGMTWAEKGDLYRAVADYNAAIKIDPKKNWAYKLRGNAWWVIKGDLERAFADYDRAIKIDPTDVVAYKLRSIAWQANGNIDRAIAEYDEAIRQSPETAELYSFRAALWEEKEEYGRARDDYDKALKIRPDDAGLRSKRESASTRAVEVVANLTPERIFDITNRVESARVLTSEDGSGFQVSVTLKEEALQALKEFSEKNIGQKTGLFHKNKLIYVAVMREALSGGNFTISGGRVTQEEAEELAEELNGKP